MLVCEARGCVDSVQLSADTAHATQMHENGRVPRTVSDFLREYSAVSDASDVGSPSVSLVSSPARSESDNVSSVSLPQLNVVQSSLEDA